MLTINLSPVRTDTPTTASLSGTILTVNGADYDLSLIPDGSTVEHPVIQQCTRTGKDYVLTLILTHGANAPEATRFPQPIVVTADGVIPLPPYDGEPA